MFFIILMFDRNDQIQRCFPGMGVVCLLIGVQKDRFLFTYMLPSKQVTLYSRSLQSYAGGVKDNLTPNSFYRRFYRSWMGFSSSSFWLRSRSWVLPKLLLSASTGQIIPAKLRKTLRVIRFTTFTRPCETFTNIHAVWEKNGTLIDQLLPNKIN